MPFSLPIIDLGRVAYRPAYDTQLQYLDRVLTARETEPIPGFLLLVEHEPVITISRRAGADKHLVATPQLLLHHNVAVEHTDRGGDITYHGPGQLVVYPILDLNLLNLGLHDYMRLLEQSVINTCFHYNVSTQRDPKATGVWTAPEPLGGTGIQPAQTSMPIPAKIAAMGVRVRRWTSFHGLALNVTTNLDHFTLIVPCGLQRPVTSLKQQLGNACPPFDAIKATLTKDLTTLIESAWTTALAKRDCIHAP